MKRVNEHGGAQGRDPTPDLQCGGFAGDVGPAEASAPAAGARRKATGWPPKKPFVPGLRRKAEGLERGAVAADPSILRTQLILHAPICPSALRGPRGRGAPAGE